MKSVRARHHDGVVLAKVLIKPYPMSLEKYKQAIIREQADPDRRDSDPC
jgi:phosphoinositide-3-kinase regulatory subunit 4